MTVSPPRRPQRSGQVPLLALLATAIVLLAVAQWGEGLLQTPEISTVEAMLPPLVAIIYAVTGIVAILRRPENHLGIVLLVGSLSVLAGGLTLMVSPVLWGVGILLGTTLLAAMVHALHAFPTGHLRGRWSTLTVATAWVVSLGFQVPIYLLGPHSPFGASPDPAFLEVAVWCQRAAGIGVMLSTAALLALRVRHATPRQRTVLAPLYVYGIAAVLLVLLAARVFDTIDPVLRLAIQLAVIAGVPVAFVVALLRGGFARTGRLDDLGVHLATSTPTRSALARSLAHTLGDPTCDIVYWSDSVGGYVDENGIRVALPAARGIVEVSIDNRRVGAISYDETVVGERALVESAARILALAIDRDRLDADLRASREELRASRERIATGADAERRRIARDLHDGLQTRLVLVALAAAEAERSGNALAVGRLRAGIDQAISELRSFVHGVMPAALTERGLASAVLEITDDFSLPVELDVRMGHARLAPAVESAAYMVVTESLANVLKHASASAVRLSVARGDRNLTVVVDDDGSGGARISNSSGLGGLRDRVEAVGGTLAVMDAPGGGSRVEAAFDVSDIDALSGT